MGKTGKWLKNFLTGKKQKDKDKVKEHEPVPSLHKTGLCSVPGPSPKEKKRWSFRSSKELNKGDINNNIINNNNGISEDDIEKTRQAVTASVATTLAAYKIEAEVEEEEAAVMITSGTLTKKSMDIEDEAAVKIQANYRAYLARKALCALRGLVKLQALIRGHLVRRQATETLRRMQALVAAQERARAQRIQMVEEEIQSISHCTPNHRRSPQHPRFQQLYEMDNYAEENIKIVEMDVAEPRSNIKGRNSYSTPQPYSAPQSEGLKHRHSVYYYGPRTPSKSDIHHNYSPCPSTLTDISPIGQSGRFEEFSFKTAQSSPQYHSAVSDGSVDYPFCPKYMSNTESSRAKARSQSAPRQRHESYERQLSRRKLSIEGRNIPRGVKMQRSSSQAGLPIIGHQFPWHLKLDRASESVRDSECGSNSSMLTNNNYCRSLAAYELHGNKY